MKKIILSAVAIMAFGFTNAQEVKFGVKAALNVSTFTGDVEKAASLVGFQAGVFTEIKVSDKFAVQPEVMFSTQGSKEDFDGGGKINLSYVNIPVMAKFYVADAFSLEAGPQIGFLVSANAKVEDVSVDIKESFNTVDFGVNFGAGYDFTENFSAGVRYNLGLANIAKTQDGDNSTVKNSVFSVSVGYKF